MGALDGIKVVELGGIGPGPFTAMMMADMGADVVRIDRRPTGLEQEHQVAELDLLQRSRRSLILDLKSDAGRETLLRLIDAADALIDPYRPGVAERLGVGPEVCMERNPRLVYGRMTGWGQDGPLANVAGHDLNYAALVGPIAAMGRRSSPPAPALNLIGDFGGGGMLLGFGILAALLERQRSGQGQVIDAAMIDGTAQLCASIIGMTHMGAWKLQRESNIVDGGAHFYDSYETADGKFITIGSIEPKFYEELLTRLGLDPEEWPNEEPSRWPELSERIAEIFKTKTRDQWTAELEGTDICFAPVLDFAEAPEHPHLKARGTYVEAFGQIHPAPAPRLSRTPSEISAPPCVPGEHSREVLSDWGFDGAEIDALEADGVTVTRERDTSIKMGAHAPHG
ncbi:MAG TPA: CaiB/BaiF CoA-transferase family protein [Solirubrobacterales bacterium]|nr:CaiB/BaiF CoA-transferase family protein [Solirubrobacterales bacterium]